MQLRRHTLPLLLIDLLLVGLAWWVAFWLRFNLDVPAEFADLVLQSMPWMLAAFAVGLLSTGVYRQVWRFIGLHELRQLAIEVHTNEKVVEVTADSLKMASGKIVTSTLAVWAEIGRAHV